MADPLPADLADALRAAGPDLPREIRLEYFAEVGSTNDIALALAGAGAPDGTAVIADAQRAGRGRRGRSWFSPAGAGMYLSAIVRAAPGAASWPLPLLTLASGVAVAGAVRHATGLPVELKWPNDVVIGRPWRKLAGVLCESAGAGARVDAVVVGIGVNLGSAAYPPELGDRATSIEIELGRPIDRGVLAIECLSRLAAAVRQLRSGGRDDMLEAWRALGRAGLSGAPVRWHEPAGERRGIARDIDVDGALVVDLGGRRERIMAGEVLWDRTN